MKSLLLAGLAVGAVLATAACSKSEEETDAAPIQETTTPPAVAPAPVSADTTMRVDSMRDTTTTTHM